jgi:hypothetical protein
LKGREISEAPKMPTTKKQVNQATRRTARGLEPCQDRIEVILQTTHWMKTISGFGSPVSRNGLRRRGPPVPTPPSKACVNGDR